MTDCLFCGIVAGDIPSEIVHETETTVAFKDINPGGAAPRAGGAAPSHRRRRRPSRPKTARSWPTCSWRPGPWRRPPGWPGPDRGYRLIFNIGPDAMNSVPHLHLHVLGGEPLKGHFGLA